MINTQSEFYRELTEISHVYSQTIERQEVIYTFNQILNLSQDMKEHSLSYVTMSITYQCD